MRALWWKIALVVVFVFATAAAFSAYLRPEMLIQFANLMLCNPGP